MKRMMAATACLLTFAIVPTLQAQDLEAGTWTGTVIPPDGQVHEVTFDVVTASDTLTVTLNSPMGPIPLRDITLDGETLTFSWSAGPTDLDCALKAQDDGSYTGECVDAGGDPGQFTMVPPQHDHDGHDGDHDAP